MNAPERLSADLEALLGAERSAPDIAPAIQDRLLARLEKTIGAPLGPDDGGGGTGGDAGGGDIGGPDVSGAADAGTALSGSIDAASQVASGAATQSGWLAAMAAKPLALATSMFALGAVSGAGVYSVLQSKDQPQPQIVYAQAEVIDAGATLSPDAVAVVAPTADAGSLPSPIAPPKRVVASRRPPASSDSRLAQERSLLEVGRTALARGNPTGAIAQFRKHARDFRRGKLSEERDALWIRALAVRGDRQAAAQRAASFRKRYPRSLFLSMVNQAAGAP